MHFFWHGGGRGRDGVRCEMCDVRAAMVLWAAVAAAHGDTRARVSQDGWTALMLAASRDRVDCVRLLLDAGADKEAKNDVRASAVVWKGALLLMVVMLWLCLEACYNFLFHFSLIFLFWICAVHYLWQTCAQVESTALICAAVSGRTDCARLLLDAGADKNAKSNVRASAVCMRALLFFGGR